jgi:hypothetical protein
MMDIAMGVACTVEAVATVQNNPMCLQVLWSCPPPRGARECWQLAQWN